MTLRRLLPIFIVFSLAMTACNKQLSSEWIPEEQMASEGVIACTAMLEHFNEVNMETATEAELEAAMQLADRSYERCKRQFEIAANTKAEQAFAAHRIAQIHVYELLFESALSRRFDAMAGYCVILRDILKVLAMGLKHLETTAEEVKLSDDQRRQLIKVYEIDLQTVEILGVQMRIACEDVPVGQLRKEREERREEIKRQMNLP